MFKKLHAIFFIFLVVMLAVTMVACGDSSNDTTEQSSDTSVPAVTDENVDLAFKAPAAAFESAEDPCLSYTFDDEGKVIGCLYTVDGRTYNVSYSYDGNQLRILAFCDSYVVAEEQFTLPGEYDPNGGFTQINGFYIKGF